MISLINHDFQWGRSEVVIIYPDFFFLIIGYPEIPLIETSCSPWKNALARALQSVRDFDCVPGGGTED